MVRATANLPLASRVADVLRRLAEGQSAQRIATELGLGRRSVQRIAAGRHYAQARRAIRCRGCGGKLLESTTPCLRCVLQETAS